MKDDLINELIVALTPYITGDIEDIKFALTIALSKYDVQIAETALTLWNGEKNDIILKRFLAAKIAKGCSRRTINYYKTSIEATLRDIGKNFDEITADDIRLWLARRVHKDKVSKTTANNERRNISSFYGWLQSEEILLKNPMTKVDSLKETKKKKKAYSLLDLEKVRLGCETNRERAFVEFLASTWCRVSEMAEVKVSDIEGNKVTVHGKGDKYRDVYLNARAQLAIEQYLKERTDSNPYFVPKSKYAVSDAAFHGRKGRKALREWYKDPELVSQNESADASTIENIVRNIGKRAGVTNCHPHRFRRTGATMALRQGMPITQVSKLLGHESIETTQIYLDISDEELEQAHKKYVI